MTRNQFDSLWYLGVAIIMSIVAVGAKSGLAQWAGAALAFIFILTSVILAMREKAE